MILKPRILIHLTGHYHKTQYSSKSCIIILKFLEKCVFTHKDQLISSKYKFDFESDSLTDSSVIVSIVSPS